MIPEHVPAAGVPVGHPTDYEQQIRQAIQVLARSHAYLLVPGKGDNAALGAATDGARKLRAGGGTCAAGQDELLQRREIGVESFQQTFELADLLVADRLAPRNADLSSQIKQVVLDGDKSFADRHREVLSQKESHSRVQFIYVAKSHDACAFLLHGYPTERL